MKNLFLKTVIITIITLFIITGCGKQAIEPVAINEQTDKCEICNMAVKDNPFATEIILENGKALVFDDIGCMNKWMVENKDKKVDSLFVRDFQTSEWLEMDQATYVFDKSIKTPMAYNIISFENKKDAETFISENNGTLLSYSDLENHSWEMNKEMMENMKNMKMDEHSEGAEMETEESDSSH